MSAVAKPDYRFTATEKAKMARDGFVVRERAFNAADCAAIAEDCEELQRLLLASKRETKHVVGSYMFEKSEAYGLNIKWEPDAPDLLMGVEPFAHFSKALNDWGHDPRFLDPCRDMIGEDEIVLFTEKVNYKRAKKGGPIILHQDFPYWEAFAPIAPRVVTAMLFLDASDAANGCLEVVPGSHTNGKIKTWDSTGLRNREIDTDAYDMSKLQPLEVPAGSIAFFDAFLVHRSLPNTSDKDRRALLYSYQPAGNPHAREIPRPFKLTDG